MLRTWRFQCGGPGSVPSYGTKIPQVSGHRRGEKRFLVLSLLSSGLKACQGKGRCLNPEQMAQLRECVNTYLRLDYAGSFAR